MDHADWNYKPFLGSIQRLRFKLALGLIQEQRYSRMLEIGYGSGVFMPELSSYCGELYGVDIHDHTAEVEASLDKHGVKAILRSSGAESLPFEDGFFECVVAVSALEFVTDLDQVCREANRVLKPGGRLIVITPGSSPLLDFGLKILTGKNAKEDFGDRRSLIVPILEKFFTLSAVRKVPGGLYQALDCRPIMCVHPSATPEIEPALAQLSEEVEEAGLQPVGVFPIDKAPLRRSPNRPSNLPPQPLGEHLIGDLNRSTEEDMQRAILAVRRRKHEAAATQLPAQQKRKESA